MRTVKNWTEEEKESLRFNYFRFTNRELSEQMGRTSASIKDQAGFLGIAKKHKVVKAPKVIRWTDAELEYLQENYHLKTVRVMSKEMGRASQAIANKAKNIGISDIVIQKLLREGKKDEALARKKAGGSYCPYLTTRFGFEKEGYMPMYTGR